MTTLLGMTMGNPSSSLSHHLEFVGLQLQRPSITSASCDGKFPIIVLIAFLFVVLNLQYYWQPFTL